MDDMLRDLYRHQEWADAEHWGAFTAFPDALADHALFTRLHHIHMVQAAFRWVIGGQREPFGLTKPADYPDRGALCGEARAYHRAMGSALDAMGDERMREGVSVPWFKDPPLTLPVREALLQAVMHSHYHRGQNATRLRELGGSPPLTDYIAWVWKGRPAPAWP